MKKYLIRFGVAGVLTFLVFFIFFYKTSGKFRQSIISALAALSVLFASQQAANSSEPVDAFPLPSKQHQSRPQKSGFFSSNPGDSEPGRNGNGGSNGSGQDDDGAGGISKFPKTESIESTKQHLVNIDKQIQKLEEVTDSDSENEAENEAENECRNQDKAGFNELPDSPKYIFKLETKTAKTALKSIWNNAEARKEVLAALERMHNGELLPRNQKNFKGFKTLKEMKFSDTRMLVRPGKNGNPDEIIVIFMKRDLNRVKANLKSKYK